MFLVLSIIIPLIRKVKRVPLASGAVRGVQLNEMTKLKKQERYKLKESLVLLGKLLKKHWMNNLVILLKKWRKTRIVWKKLL